MWRPDDEMLMAYADGALPADDMRAIEHVLGADAEARRRLVSFRITRDLVRSAYEEPMWADVPQRLIDTALGRAPVHARSSRRSGLRALMRHVVGWFAHKRSGSNERWVMGGLATGLAAAALMLIVVTTDQGRAPRAALTLEDIALGPLAPGNPLAQALEANHRTSTSKAFRPAGAAVGADARFILVARLRDRLGNPCQELDVLPAVEGRLPIAVVLSCRLAGGGWSVIAAVTPKAPGRRDGTTYVGSEDDAHRALSSALSMIGASQRMSTIPSESRAE